MAKGPVLFDLEEDTTARPSVSDAPPVPDVGAPAPQGQAMQIAARLAARKPSKLVRLFWWLLTTLIGALVSIAAWNFIMGLLASYPLLGLAMTVLIGAVLLVLVLLCLRELAAFSRLARLDGLHHDVGEALAQNDLKAARAVTDRLVGLYQGREDTRWGRDRLAELRGDRGAAGGGAGPRPGTGRRIRPRGGFIYRATSGRSVLLVPIVQRGAHADAR